MNYDWSFDKSHKNADCIYRVERTSGDGATVPTNRPLADIFFQSSPHIKAGALVSHWQKEIYFTIDKNGEKVSYLDAPENSKDLIENFKKNFDLPPVSKA